VDDELEPRREQERRPVEEAERDLATYGEADEEDVTEVVEDPGEGPDDPGRGPGLASER
jgi:hypothetical protein